LHDGLLWIGCLVLALALRFPTEIPALEWEYLWRFLPLSGAALLFGLFYRGVYRNPLEDEWAWRDIWWGWLIGTALSAFVLVGLKIPFSRFVFTLGTVSYLALLIIDRLVVRLVKQHLWPREPETMAAVGFPTERKRTLSDLFQGEISWFHFDELSGSLDQLIELDPDIVLLNPAQLTVDNLDKVCSFGSRYQVPVRMVPTSREHFFQDTTTESWQGVRLLRSDLHYSIQQQLAVKTTVDFFLAILLLPVVVPLLITVSILILLFDGRPVIYSQERVGRGGVLFQMYKFRTMEQDMDGPELTVNADDPRITSIGRWLRRFSLDELPQFFHILRGEMSFVGPRPEIPSITKNYSNEQRVVLWLKPGLTGLSQVSGREELALK